MTDRALSMTAIILSTAVMAFQIVGYFKPQKTSKLDPRYVAAEVAPRPGVPLHVEVHPEGDHHEGEDNA